MSVFTEFVVPVTAAPLGSLLAGRPGVTVEIDRRVRTDRSGLYAWVDGIARDDLLAAVRDDEAVETAVVVDELRGRLLVWLDLAGGTTPLFEITTRPGGRLVGAAGTADGWTLYLQFPCQRAVSSFYEACVDGGIAAELRQIHHHEAGLGGGDGHGLSTAQHEAVRIAFETGYFEVPRETTIAELAERLDVSEQAVSERLRRGLHRLLAATVADEADETAETDDG
jgi:predicted DNA binding protein